MTSTWGGQLSTITSSSSPSLLSPFLPDRGSDENFSTESIITWKEEKFLGNKSLSSVMDSLGITLQMVLNGTKRLEAETGLGFGEFSSTPPSDSTPFTSSFGDELEINNGSSLLTTSTASATGGGSSSAFPGKSVIIPLYTLIFFLSFIGNLMVILTLARNRRMRTVTNILLLNLSVSDLLLGVFCMPVTLIGQLLRNFIFGAAMCRLLPYFQGVSVSVSCWTLCAISLERYFAICRPLQSRKWQTRSHAYKMILVVWLFSLTWNLPITFASTLQPIRNSGRFKCREIWPSEESEKVFNLVLDFLLLLIPLLIMGMAYALIVSKLWKGLQSEIRHTRSFRQHGPHGHLIQREDSIEMSTHSPYIPVPGPEAAANGNVCSNGSRLCIPAQKRDSVSNEIVTFRGGKGVVVRWRRKNAVEIADTTTTNSSSCQRANCCRCPSGPSEALHPHPAENGNHKPNGIFQGSHLTPSTAQPPSSKLVVRAIRSTYTGKSIESKKKVIRMLFVLVAEFFVCWTPLYVMNTWYLFDSEAVYNNIGAMGVSLIQLLSFSSSCSNPITYCFMNRKFRQAFIKVFQCSSPKLVIKTGPQTLGRGSDVSANESLIYGAQPSTLNKSVLVLDCENRV